MVKKTATLLWMLAIVSSQSMVPWTNSASASHEFTQTSEPPTEFPLSLFKGNNTVYRYSSVPMGNGAIAFVLLIDTADSPDTILNWYRTYLRSAGWQTTEHVPPGYSPVSAKYLNATLKCKKDKVVSTIIIRGQLRPLAKSLTEITAFDFTKGLPQ
ncbi:MAG: hypothetical protein HY711_03530 [Candidatus Melainabacteria bacterium]|nr:hypothetical protein [Candidatus Melainabacteria bacterium]